LRQSLLDLLTVRFVKTALTRWPSSETRRAIAISCQELDPPVRSLDVPPLSSVRRLSARGICNNPLGSQVETGTSDDGGHTLKTMSVRDLQKSIKEAVDHCQNERVIVTRHGRPTAVLVRVEGRDLETVELETSEGLWKLIEQRRMELTISSDELEKRLEERSD
jgi:antitoxin (DNA-binding transcriptional repressor) of toxin-antitoxin stability system